MSSDSTTEARWPLLRERAPFATTPNQGAARRRRLPRSAWLLPSLAFLCGGLVSAAAFSIGWRHQAQRDNATQTALAAATAKTHRLEQKITTLQASLADAHTATAQANASAATATAAEKDLAHVGGRISAEAAASNRNAASLAAGAGSLGGSASRIASELKTLETYLTTTPAGQLDPGYIVSQTSFLDQRLTRLEDNAGNLGDSAASFKAALRKLGRDAAALKTR